MFLVRTAVATLALVLLGDAAAQLPPTPDVTRFP